MGRGIISPTPGQTTNINLPIILLCELNIILHSRDWKQSLIISLLLIKTKAGDEKENLDTVKVDFFFFGRGEQI